MSEINYSQQKPQGLLDQLALKKRLAMLALFKKHFPDEKISHILDVGVTADKDAKSSNYLENFYPHKNKITGLSNQALDNLAAHYPEIKFQMGDACALPYADKSIDVVFSSAVIEHVGSSAKQLQMLKECVRVAKQGVFITTPNRWHPIEVHTLYPLIHWLPKKWHRFILRKLGLNFYAKEENLNLMDSKTLISFCKQLNINSFQIKKLYTLGFISNLILIIYPPQSS